MSLLASDTIGSQQRHNAQHRAYQAAALVARRATPFLVCAGLWFFCHPYLGIVGDSRIYIGRALADLDPGGVGRDLMFVNDGQSAFSLFPALARSLVALLGASRAAEIIGVLGCLCWLAAALALAFRLAQGRAAWLLAIVVCGMSTAYGDRVFFFAESLALPRPFAEAAVLAAIAAYIAKWRVLAAGLICIGLLIHPIMALPGLGVLAILALGAWRALAAATVLLVLSAILGWAGIPVFDRLLIRMDDEWLALILQSSPHMFPTLWHSRSFSSLIIQAATLAIAASLTSGPVRSVFIASLLVGAGGVGLAAALGDIWASVLVVQAQLWRSTWLMAVLAHFAYAICIARLWSKQASPQNARVILALLTFGWFFQGAFFAPAAAAVLALLLRFRPSETPIAPRFVATLWIAIICAILVSYVSIASSYLHFISALPAGWFLGVLFGLRGDVAALPVCVLAALWFHGTWRFRYQTALGLCGGSALIVGAALLWSSRPLAAVDMEELDPPPQFASLVNERAGEVLWVDGKSEGWQILRRPQWASVTQSFSAVFSRQLAMAWRERAQFLLDNGLIAGNAFAPWKWVGDSAIREVARPALVRLCARADAPVAVVFPLEKGHPSPRDIPAAVWKLPHVRYVMDANDRNVWHEVDRYAAVSCAALRD
jgi:hypothetical protein